MKSRGDLELVLLLGHLIESIHSVVYFAPEPQAAYASLGLRGYWRGYLASRCAAAGAIGPDLATALLGGFAPSMVARAVPEVWSIAEPTTVTAARLEAATAALRRLFADVDPDLVLVSADLTARCVAALPVAGRPMAAAHRELTRPADAIGALWHDTTVLREFRGDGHLAALAVSGLRWPEPHLLIRTRLDAEQQTHRGWSDSEWSCAQQRVAGTDVAQIDDATDKLAAPAFELLSETELRKLAAALVPLARAAATQLPYPNAMGLPRLAARTASSPDA